MIFLPAPIEATGPYRTFYKGRCTYCGNHVFRFGPTANPKIKYTRDHVIPRKKNKHHWTVACCLDCNQKKADRMPTQQELTKARRGYNA